MNRHFTSSFIDLPAEIRASILDYTGFPYAVLFNDQFAITRTYNPIEYDIFTAIVDGNVSAVEWILRNTPEKIWKFSNLVNVAFMMGHYDLAQRLLKDVDYPIEKVPEFNYIVNITGMHEWQQQQS